MKAYLLYQLFSVAAMCISAEAGQMTTVGSTIKLETAASEATGACIATLESHGTYSPASSGVALLSGCAIRMRHNLLELSKDPVEANFRIVGYLKSEPEKLPAIGTPFLLIGGVVGERLEITKIVEPTVSNIQVVSKILEGRGMKISPIHGAELQAILEPSTPSAPLVPPLTVEIQRGVKPSSDVSKQATNEPTRYSIQSLVIMALILVAFALLWWQLKKKKM
jgi:hypothetical protein